MEIIGKEGSFFLGPGPQNKMRVPFYSRLSLKPKCWKKKIYKIFLRTKKYLFLSLPAQTFRERPAGFFFFQTRTKFREENQVFV